MNVTAPMLEPVAPLVTVIQLTALTAVHEHEVPVMMLSVRWLASEPTENVVGVTVNEHWRASANEVPASQARTTSAQQRRILMVQFLEHRQHGPVAAICAAQGGPSLRTP